LGTHFDLGHSDRQCPAVAENAIKVPADMIAVGDSPLGASYLDSRSGQSACLELLFSPLSGGSMPAYFRYPTHGAKANTVFCDGHVESQKRLILYGLSNKGMVNPNAFCRWRSDHLPLMGPD
jgi:prepilin-type processing-associated H-X9-DG protein